MGSACLWRLEEYVRPSGTGITGSYLSAPWHGYLDMNPGPFQEEQMLFTTEPSLQSQDKHVIQFQKSKWQLVLFNCTICYNFGVVWYLIGVSSRVSNKPEVDWFSGGIVTVLGPHLWGLRTISVLNVNWEGKNKTKPKELQPPPTKYSKSSWIRSSLVFYYLHSQMN